MTKLKKTLRENLLLVLIVGTAFVVRVWGNNFGLPDLLVHSDENEYVAAAEAVVDGVPGPYKIGLPVSSFYYLLLTVYRIFRFFVNEKAIAVFFPLGRTFSALLSTISVLSVYLIGKNLFGKKAGLFASLALALYPIDVQIAHYIKEDVYIQFFGTLSLLFLSYAINKPTFIWLSLSVVFAVFAGSAKINGFFYVFPVALFLLFSDKNGILRLQNLLQKNLHKLYFLVLFFLSLVAFVLNSPISLMEDPSKKYSLSAIISPESGGLIMSTNQDGMANYIWWPLYLGTTGIGPLFFILFVTSFIWAVTKRKTGHLIMLAAITPYLIVMLVQSQRFDRWITVITPAIAVLSGAYLSFLVSTRKKTLRYLVTFLITIAILIHLSYLAYMDFYLSNVDTRARVVDFIKHNTERAKDVLLFGEGLDPSKHFLNINGYQALDFTCEKNLEGRFPGMYVVLNQTIIDIFTRFPASYRYKQVVECAQRVKNSGQVVTRISNPKINNPFYGLDSLVGPAVFRYLHHPTIIIVKINSQKPNFEYEYTPDKMTPFLYQMQSSIDFVSSFPDKPGRVGGPYLIIPSGKYKISFDFSVENVPKDWAMESVVLSAYSDAVGEIKSIKKSGNVGRNTQELVFETDRPIQLQTLISSIPPAILRVYGIKIMSY